MSTATEERGDNREETRGGLLRQPKAVWAVAFACVISFMGIGLVDPILPAISEGLDATPSQVSLLFTSYLVVTAFAMLGVNWVSSRIGAKRALVLGLALIVIFSALAGASGTVNEIIGFRGGWGLGNALFIATSLSVIVASASGGYAGAIILYEAALGLGIAAGPLIGGLLGDISWRGPFFGVAVLMAVALTATLLLIPEMPRPTEKISLSAPVKALRHRGLLTMGIMALLYNWGFFTMLGYAPYPMKLDALQLGFVFTGWGLLVAAFAVFFAPRLQRRFGTAAVLYANLLLLGVVMVVIAVGIDHPVVVIAAVIVSGAGIGINNTLTTQAVMLVSPVEKSVASSSYGFVRFIGGGLAPFVAGKIADSAGASWAFALGAAAFLVAIPVLASGRRFLSAAGNRQGAATADSPDVTGATATVDATGGDVDIVRVGDVPEGFSLGDTPVLAAVDGTDRSLAVIEEAVELSRSRSAAVALVHVRETDVVGDTALTREDRAESVRTVERNLSRLRENGVECTGFVVDSIGDHADVGVALGHVARRIHAGAVVVGRTSIGTLAHAADADIVGVLAADSEVDVVVVS